MARKCQGNALSLDISFILKADFSMTTDLFLPLLSWEFFVDGLIRSTSIVFLALKSLSIRSFHEVLFVIIDLNIQFQISP